jgi:hypothetical protein
VRRPVLSKRLTLSDPRKQEPHLLKSEPKLPPPPGVILAQSGLGSQSSALKSDPQPGVDHGDFSDITARNGIGDVLDKTDDGRRRLTLVTEPAVRFAELLRNGCWLLQIKRGGEHMSLDYATFTPKARQLSDLHDPRVWGRTSHRRPRSESANASAAIR